MAVMSVIHQPLAAARRGGCGCGATQVLFGLLIACALLGAAATPARAHAVLVETTPADGQVVDSAPEQVVLRFSEAVTHQPGGLRVIDSGGHPVDLGDAAQTARDTLAVGLDDDPADGTYVTAWRTVSADGHPIRGAFVFSVGEEGGSADAAVISDLLAGGADRPWQFAAAAARWLGYATVMLAAGGLLFLLWIHDRTRDERGGLVRITSAAAAAGILVTLVAVGVQGALTSGLGVEALTSPAVLGGVLNSSYGTAAAVRIAGLLIVGLALRGLWSTPATVAGIAGALLALSSFALTGHSVTTDPRWLAAGAVFAHTLFGAAWFGGLVLLAVVLRRRHAGDAVGGGRMVARFSSYALATVAVVVVAGSALAWAEVRSLEGLWSTSYGLTLLVKVAAVAAIIAIALYNRQRLVPAIARQGERAGDGSAWARLARSLRVESFGIVGVLLLTAVLTAMTPAREQLSGPFTEYAQLGDLDVNLTVDPARVGTNELHIYLLSPGGQPADVADSVTVLLSHPGEDIGPIEREPVVAGPGHWILTGPELSIAGTWEVTVRVQLSRFEEQSATFSVEVRP